MGIHACSLVPTPTTDATSSKEAALVTVQEWASHNTPTINWSLAQQDSNWVVAPLANVTNPFASSQKSAYRFLVAHAISHNACTGTIVELVSEQSTFTAAQAIKAALLGAQRLQTKQVASEINSFTGWMIMYSSSYEYQTSLIYQSGHLESGQVRIQLVEQTSARKNTSGTKYLMDGAPSCYAVTKCGYAGEYVSTCMTTNYCIDNGSGNGGDGGDSGSGGSNDNGGVGWGGGGNVGSSASSTVAINVSGPKISPAQENRCFTKSQSATLTVYVQQGSPGTRAPVGVNQVGHTFIGIEQNGITRYMGYYPESSAGTIGLTVGRSYAGEIHDNSNSPYNVSITAPVSSEQLNNILNYINNAPVTYNLNSYNCADFGIAVGNLGGMNLPNTTSSGIFSGRSPGNLGEDIRSMNPPSGGSINTNGGNSPTKQGTCL